MVKFLGLDIRLTKNRGRSRVSGYALTDEDREDATAVKRIKQQQRMIERESNLMREKMRLEQIRSDYLQLKNDLTPEIEEEEDDANAMLMSVLLPALMSKFQPQTTPDPFSIQQQTAPEVGIPASAVSQVTLSDEQIKELINSQPKQVLKFAKKSDDATLRKLMYSHMPGMAPETIDKAIIILRNEF